MDLIQNTGARAAGSAGAGDEPQPPAYEHRYYNQNQDGIESLFDDEDVMDPDAYVLIPTLDSLTRRQTERFMTSMNITLTEDESPAAATEQNGNHVPNCSTADSQSQQSVAIANAIENQLIESPGSFVSVVSSISSSESTSSSLEDANAKLVGLTENYKMLKELELKKSKDIAELKSSLNELDTKRKTSELEAKKKIDERQIVIEKLMAENLALQAKIDNISYEKETDIGKLTELIEEQKSFLTDITFQNNELRVQIQLKDAELLETKTSLLKVSDDSEKFEKKAKELEESNQALEQLKKNYNSLQGEYTRLIEEKKELLIHLQSLTDSHERIDNTRIALLKEELDQNHHFKEQMEENKLCYEAEKRDRIAMEQEKLKLDEELAKLKLEVAVKDAELEKLHTTHIKLINEHINQKESVSAATGAAAGGPGKPSSDATTDDDEIQIMPCPVCGKRFTTESALINHAANCGVKPTNPFVFP